MLTRPEMYSDEGDQAVIRALINIAWIANNNLEIRNRETLLKAAGPILQATANLYPEIYDTEPRNWINDRLNEICRSQGWSYNLWERYDW